ncbi:MAG: hypothetical protein V4710_01485, partial [Verrucomicrobiota bacterium]
MLIIPKAGGWSAGSRFCAVTAVLASATASVGGAWVHHGHVNEVWYQSFQQLGLAEALVGMSREACALYFG